MTAMKMINRQGVEDHANEGLNHPQSSFILYLRGKR